MTLTANDIFLAKLTAWREAANQGSDGLTAVVLVIRNRALKNNTSLYTEATKEWQFSSICIGSFGNENLVANLETDTEVIRLKKKVNNGNMFINILSKWPLYNDLLFQSLDAIVQAVGNNTQQDITNGATSYYAQSIAPPAWATNGKMIKTCQIKDHIFFKDVA